MSQIISTPDRGRKGRILPADTGLAFLTTSDLPDAVRPGFRKGEVVTVLRRRVVCRTGYRLRADDPEIQDAVTTRLNTPEGREAMAKLFALCEDHPCDPSDPAHVREGVRSVLARTLVALRGFGGSARGVWVADGLCWIPEGEFLEVGDTRYCRAGDRYGPSGGSRGGFFDDFDDYEPGGLDKAKTYGVVQVCGVEMLAGDLRPVCPARCYGTLQFGEYVHANHCTREVP